MPALILPQVNSGISTDELGDIVAKGFKDIEWLNSGFIDGKNIRNIAGFNVSATQLKHISGLVGMSGADPANNNAIRFWSGNANPAIASFRVTQGGTMYATDANITGIITGGTVRTAASGARIELSSNSLRTYATSGQLNGPAWGSAIGAGMFGDTSFYHEGVELLNIYDNATSYSIKPGSGTSSMTLGAATKTIFANGTWNFSSGVSGTVYVAAVSGGSPTIPITFTTGLRTS